MVRFNKAQSTTETGRFFWKINSTNQLHNSKIFTTFADSIYQSAQSFVYISSHGKPVNGYWRSIAMT